MSLHKTPVSCNNDLIGHNFKVGKQTFIIPLIFTNINDVKDIITRIGYGGDVWELRVDLLSPNAGPLGETNLPPLEYVKQQVEALRSILFTIRTQSQGGKFPDKAAEEALALMLVAVACGIKYIDVEVEWPASMLETITEKKGSSQVVASFHDWTGNIRWTSQALKERFKAADKFGDIIKLSILSATIYDCHELALFVRDYSLTRTKPLLAVGMGASGQLSRITSPISLVMHPLIPFPSAPGQLSLAQVHQALFLIGQLLKREFQIFSTDVSAMSSKTKVANAFNSAFLELGYPYRCTTYVALTGSKGLGFEIQSQESADSLLERICQQFSLWTGRPAQVSVITDALSGTPDSGPQGL